jgi:hypothetical protein
LKWSKHHSEGFANPLCFGKGKYKLWQGLAQAHSERNKVVIVYGVLWNRVALVE